MFDDNEVAFCIPLNPEPWAMGKVFRKGPGVGVAPDKTMKNYQAGLAAELKALGLKPRPGTYEIRLTFSRQLVQYTTGSGRTSTRNAADVTNMQKATEDALQGVGIDNDRAVVRIDSALAGPQERDTTPYVMVYIKYNADYSRQFNAVEEAAYYAMLDRENENQTLQANVWEP